MCKVCLYQPFEEPNHGGLCRQVVPIQRCYSMTEVANEPAHSGLYRQVVFLYECFFSTVFTVCGSMMLVFFNISLDIDVPW